MTRTFGNPLLSHSPNDFLLEVTDDCFFLLWCDSITSPFLYWSVVLWPAARTECSWDDGVFGPCGDLPSLPESSAGVRVQLVRELQANRDPTQAGRASCEGPLNYFIKETNSGSGLWDRISTRKVFSLFYANVFHFLMNHFFKNKLQQLGCRVTWIRKMVKSEIHLCDKLICIRPKGPWSQLKN